MARKIISISFLYEEERIRIYSDSNGKFPLPKIKANRRKGDPISYMHPYTAQEFVEHKKVKKCDPVLSLSDGTKLRVYLNGNPTGAVVESLSVIENHDKSCSTRKKLLNGARRNPSFTTEYYDQGHFGFDCYGFDDDTD